MRVIAYDSFQSEAGAKLAEYVDLDTLLAESDVIFLHCPLFPSTEGMINKENIPKMKDGVIVLNYARDLLVNEADMAEALESGKVRRYMCDFANPNTLAMKNCIVTPHLGASTEESEENCAAMAVQEIRNYLENGNIINSVNFPRLDKGEPKKAYRTGIFYKDADALEKIKALAGEDVEGAMRGKYGYALADTDAKPDLVEYFQIPGVFQVVTVK